MQTSDLTSLVETFFVGMGIQINSLTVSENEDSIDIVLQTPDSSILIGMHGKNINTIRHLLGRMIERVRGHFFHIHIEINDYMKTKNERLFRFLDKKVATLRSIGGRMPLPDLNAFDRKKAHNYIAQLEINGLSSRSEWERGERVLYLEYTGEIVSPKHTEASTTTQNSDLSEDGIGI